MKQEDRGVPAAPSGHEASPSAADASSQGRVPNAGEYVIWRDWGLNVREIAQVTPKLIKLRRGGYPSQFQIADKRILAFVPDYETAVRLKDSIAGVDGEFHRRRAAADRDRTQRVDAASDARDRAVERLIRDVLATAKDIPDHA